MSWCFALFLFALSSSCWYSPPFFPVMPTRVLLLGCSRGGWPYLMLQCYIFLYLLCISCPMDLQCPIKAVTINQSKSLGGSPSSKPGGVPLNIEHMLAHLPRVSMHCSNVHHFHVCPCTAACDFCPASAPSPLPPPPTPPAVPPPHPAVPPPPPLHHPCRIVSCSQGFPRHLC